MRQILLITDGPDRSADPAGGLDLGLAYRIYDRRAEAADAIPQGLMGPRACTGEGLSPDRNGFHAKLRPTAYDFVLTGSPCTSSSSIPVA